MPAKKRITKEDILRAAVAIARESGFSSVNTTTLTQKLNCSTQPFYLSFKNMEELKAELLCRIFEIYKDYIRAELQSGKYPTYKAYGMGYIRFASQEKQLFKRLFMQEQAGKDDTLGEIYSVIMRNTGLSEDRAKLFHLESWVFVHGIAVMLATEYLEMDEALIGLMLTDMYEGLKARFGV